MSGDGNTGTLLGLGAGMGTIAQGSGDVWDDRQVLKSRQWLCNSATLLAISELSH